MKRFVSCYDDRYYTHMLKLLNAIGGRNLDFNWLITDIEAYPNDEEIDKLVRQDYVFISNNELIDLLEKDDFQWIWAIFTAIDKKVCLRDILQYELPDQTRVSYSYKEKAAMQHPLAEIEIDCFDSSEFQIIAKGDYILKDFKKVYPKTLEFFNSPLDYFKTQENITCSSAFEFSYYKYKIDYSIKEKIVFRFTKKKPKYPEDSIFIYEEYFNDLLEWYPCFKNTSEVDGKATKFAYFGPNNYYDKKQAEVILQTLKDDLKTDDKLIIKFLEKAINEHDGFYIHGI